MIYFIIILFSLLFAFSFYSRKFQNNFKLIYLFGKKGSGKSTLMIKWMLRDLRNGWTVYTDMVGVNIKGVRFISSVELLSRFAPPPMSSIYLDEGGLSMDARQFKSFPPGLRDFFALQRKYKCKVVINSQSYDVDKKIRDRVDRMFLQSNIGNVIGISRPIIRSVALTEASSQGESRIADQLKFDHIWRWKLTWLPRYFKYFTSFNAPAREEVPFTELSGLSPKSELSRIRRGFSRRR